jgi:hypothetical protein
MKRGLILLSAICLALAGATSASVQQGDTELEFLAGAMSQNGDGGGVDFEAYFATGSLGYFVTDNIQISGAALLAFSETSFGGGFDVDIDIYGIGARGKYHFMPTNVVVPYIGGQAFWANVDIDVSGPFGDTKTDAILWGPLAGVRVELNAYNDLFVEYQYHMWCGDVRDSDNSIGLDDGHALFLGIIHQFR